MSVGVMTARGQETRLIDNAGNLVTVTNNKLDVNASVSLGGLAIPQSDTILATYPTATQEVYTYKLNGTTVATVTVDYATASKEAITSVVKS